MLKRALRSAVIVLPCVLPTALTAPGAWGQQPHEAAAANQAASPRLSVRPHEMATGTETKQGGLQHVPGLEKYLIYVPQQCVGKKRVPLVVYLPGGGRSSQNVLGQEGLFADKYGMILLLPNATTPGRWEVILEGMVAREEGHQDSVWRRTDTGEIDAVLQKDVDIRKIDTAMKYVLANYAIDPDKIALAGFSDGGSYTLFLGRNNLDIFSRLAGLSALIPFTGHGPKNDQARFILSGGIGEGMIGPVLRVTRQLRKEGHEVEPVLALRRHAVYAPDDAYAWSWLANSWAAPREAAPETPLTPDNADPALTSEALAKMTTFWKKFMDEPGFVRDLGRQTYQQHVRLSVGDMPVSVIMMDTPAMAASFPSVAADLQAAGLTAEEADAYRRAVVRVEFTLAGDKAAGPVAKGSVLEKNLDFYKKHRDEFKQLDDTQMMLTQ